MKQAIASVLLVLSSAIPASADSVLASQDFTLSIEEAAPSSAIAAPCTAAGGEVADAAGTEVCRFTTTYCPAGWSQHQGWSTWTWHRVHLQGNYYPDPNSCSNNDSFQEAFGVYINTGSRSWSNYLANPSQVGFFSRRTACTFQTMTVTAPVEKRTQIGCLPN
jgi:hypothetical protein